MQIKNRWTGEVLWEGETLQGAATLLLWRPGCELPSFAPDAPEAETLGRLRVMAAAATTAIPADPEPHSNAE